MTARGIGSLEGGTRHAGNSDPEDWQYFQFLEIGFDLVSGLQMLELRA